MKSLLKKVLWKWVAGAMFKKFLKKTSQRGKWSKPYDKPYRRHGKSDLPWGYRPYRYYDYPHEYQPKAKKSGWKKEVARSIAQTMRRRLGAR